MKKELEDTGEQTEANIKRFIHHWRPGEEKKVERQFEKNYRYYSREKECNICLKIDANRIWTIADK